jgi:hypothetical protein
MLSFPPEVPLFVIDLSVLEFELLIRLYCSYSFITCSEYVFFIANAKFI